MRKHWLLSAAAVLALVALPARAEETATKPPTTPEKAATAPAAPAPPVKMAQADPPAEKPAQAAEEEVAPASKFTYGGSADFYFSTNFNDPFTGTNLYRAWDLKDEDGVNLGLIDIWAQYARDPIGFRLDLNFGPTAHIFHAAETSNGEMWNHIQQVLVSANLSKDGKTYVELGKFVTPVGAEVAEPRDNWLTTRGILFNLAQPFYHLGGKLTHYFNDTDYVSFAGHRGWNSVGNPNHGPGFIFSGGKAINPKLTLVGNLAVGDEPGPKGTDFRTLFDLVALYNPGGKLQYTFNMDVAGQDGANWYGVSGQARYNVNAKQYATLRGEILRDNGGLLSGSNQTLAGITLGYAYLFNKYAQARVEYRHDFSNRGVYPEDRVGTFSKGQDTFLVSAIFGY